MNCHPRRCKKNKNKKWRRSKPPWDKHWWCLISSPSKILKSQSETEKNFHQRARNITQNSSIRRQKPRVFHNSQLLNWTSFTLRNKTNCMQYQFITTDFISGDNMHTKRTDGDMLQEWLLEAFAVFSLFIDIKSTVTRCYCEQRERSRSQAEISHWPHETRSHVHFKYSDFFFLLIQLLHFTCGGETENLHETKKETHSVFKRPALQQLKRYLCL